MMTSLDQNLSQLRELFCNSYDYKSAINILQNMTLLMQSAQNREQLNRSHWEEIANLTNIGSKIFLKKDYVIEELDFVAEVFRFLRNSCGGFSENQHHVLNTPSIFDFAKQPLLCFLSKEGAKEIAVLKICIQLFGNIILCNDGSKSLVWGLFFGENTFKYLLNSSDLTVREYTMMVLYNCMSEESSKCILSTNEGHDILIAVTNCLIKNSSDWGMLFMEYLLKNSTLLECSYDRLPLENRLLILDIIIEYLKCTENDENVMIRIPSLEYVNNRFLNHVNGIAKLCNIGESDMQPAEIMKMLSLLCSASVCNAYILYMLSNKLLLGKCVETLKCVHLLGKESCNAFSAVSNLTKSNEQMECHPLFGFKKDLIRLIGNLCYGCKENQDLVRQLDGIPLVLDCCKLDAKNPYIMQWCILAIRNILEKNPDNQAVVSAMTTTGEIADPSVLKELGIQMHFDGGKLSLK